MINLTPSSISGFVLLDNSVSPWCSCNLDSRSGKLVVGTYHPMPGQGLVSLPWSILGRGIQKDLPTSSTVRVVSLNKATC